MEVNLVHGRRVYTNSGRLPREIVQQGYSRSDDEDSSDDSDAEPEDPKRSSSLTDMRGQRRAEKQARKADRRARKEEKRTMKKGRKDNRRNERDAQNEPWKLVITFRPTVAS